MLTWGDIGIVIRAVRGPREAFVDSLLDQMEDQDIGREYEVSYHAEGRSVPESYTDALAALGDYGFRWILQFEDDVVLAPDFAEHAIRLLREADMRTDVGLVSFYSGRRIRPDEVLPVPPLSEYIPGSRFLMAQAFAIRNADVADHNAAVLRWTTERDRPYGGEFATAAWLASRRYRIARSWPSLVQHRDAPSLYKQRNTNRPHSPGAGRRSPSYTAAYGEI